MNLQYGKRPDSARTADRKSINMSFRTSPQTGVGIPAVQQTAFQFSCHSEPVLKLVWESPSSLRPRLSKDGDCHARKMMNSRVFLCRHNAVKHITDGADGIALEHQDIVFVPELFMHEISSFHLRFSFTVLFFLSQLQSAAFLH